MKKTKTILAIQIILGISLAMTMLIGPVLMISFNRPFYNNHIENTDFNKINKIEASNLIHNTIDFLMHKDYLDDKFSENEKSHMLDVRKIFDTITILYFISILGIIASITYLKIKEKNFTNIYKPIKFASISVLGICILIIILSVFNFESIFIIFHQIFFPQGNWLFPQGSLLITLFTENFFFKTSTLIFIIIIVQAALISAGSIFIEKKIK